MPDVLPKIKYKNVTRYFRAKGLPHKKTTKPMAEKSGAVYYFTGKPCVRKHIDLRYTSNGKCRTCNLEEHRKGYWKLRGWDQVQAPDPQASNPP